MTGHAPYEDGTLGPAVVNRHQDEVSIFTLCTERATQNLQGKVVWSSYGSLTVIENGTARKITYNFLLAFRNSYVPILYHSNITNRQFYLPISRLGVTRCNFHQNVWQKRTREPVLQHGVD